MQFLFRLLARSGWGIDDRHAGPGGTPLQVAALPFELAADGTLRILLITSRRSGRWIVPKGWPVRGLTFGESAAREAFEEAGVRGDIGPELGVIAAVQDVSGARSVPMRVHGLRVTEQLERWRESHQRRRRWVSQAEAVELVSSAPLAQTIAAFDPAGLRSVG
jgi:8-oxo-dGTP pyrophosphatase MutT (NUDIX family)